MLAHNLYRFFEGLSSEDMEQKMENLFCEYDTDNQGTIDAEVNFMTTGCLNARSPDILKA